MHKSTGMMQNMTSELTHSPSTVRLLDGAAQVLAAVRLHGCKSRGEIMERTGLTRMVTAQRVQQLLDLGLLQEEGLRPSSGGRRPRQLTFLPPGHLLVADVGFTSIDVAITDLGGRLLAHTAEPADITDGPDAILSRVETLLEQLVAETPDLGYRWGVGLGIPAPVEFSTGRTVSPPVGHGWDDYPARERLARHFGAPTWVDKDVNIMMLGERQEGAAKGHHNAIFVKCGTGIGISLISEGHLHRGAQGCAGDLGHLLYLATNVGNSELLPPAGSPRFWLTSSVVRKAVELAENGTSAYLAGALAQGETITTRLIAEAAEHGDTPSLNLLRHAGTLVGTTLASIVSLFNPSLVVIGGGMSDSGDFFLAAIREVVYGQSIPLATRDLRIVKAELGSNAGVVGAATMVLDQLFSDENLEETVTNWVTAR